MLDLCSGTEWLHILCVGSLYNLKTSLAFSSGQIQITTTSPKPFLKRRNLVQLTIKVKDPKEQVLTEKVSLQFPLNIDM